MIKSLSEKKGDYIKYLTVVKNKKGEITRFDVGLSIVLGGVSCLNYQDALEEYNKL